MSRWFRFYDEAVDDPKVQRLAPHSFKAWVNLLCLAGKGGGILPSITDISFHLRMSETDAKAVVDELILVGLIDITPENKLTPHNWSGRQYVSDTSKERVRRYRERRKMSGLPQQHYANPKQKAAIMAKTDGKCAYCGTTGKLTIDHMVPVGRGGTDDIDNLIPACRACNADKRHMTHDEYLAWDGRKDARNDNGNGSVTLRKRPQTSESYPEQNTESPDLPSSLTAARVREGEDQGNLIGLRGRGQGRQEKIIRRAEGLGVPTDELVAAVNEHKAKNRSAYFTALCVAWFAKRLPGISEQVVRDALWGTDAQYAVLLSLMAEAA